MNRVDLLYPFPRSHFSKCWVVVAGHHVNVCTESASFFKQSAVEVVKLFHAGRRTMINDRDTNIVSAQISNVLCLCETLHHKSAAHTVPKPLGAARDLITGFLRWCLLGILQSQNFRQELPSNITKRPSGPPHSNPVVIDEPGAPAGPLINASASSWLGDARVGWIIVF